MFVKECIEYLNINFFVLATKFLQPVNLAILTIWSPFNPLAVPAPHLLSPFLVKWQIHQPSPHWKSQTAHSDMHHSVSGINSLIHSSASPVMSRLTSSFTCQLISVIIATLIIHHSFTTGSKPTFSTNPSHLNNSSTMDCLHNHETRPDLSCFLIYF